MQVAGKADLSDAYHHLALHPDLRHLFQFQINGCFYECIALPFGWNLAPFTFTKFTKPAITALRNPDLLGDSPILAPLSRLRVVKNGFHIQIYIDDVLILSVDAATQSIVADCMLHLFSSLGILCHPGKCELAPVPSISFLGMQLHVPTQKFFLTAK